MTTRVPASGVGPSASRSSRSSPSRVLAARNTGRAAEEPPQLAAALEHPGRRREVELEVAGDRDRGRAERGEPRRVGLGLRADRREIFERRSGERRDARVAARRLLRQPRVRQQERHAAGAAFAHQVGPELGFHQDAERRAEVRDEPADRPREVVGQERERRELAVEARRRLAPGRGHVGHEERVIGIARAQARDERLRRARLAERDRVDPDHRPVGGARCTGRSAGATSRR